MRLSHDLLLASSNASKYGEARAILARHGVSLGHLECDLEEIQSGSLGAIAARKAAGALSLCARPVIAEDAGLFVDALNGFPGPYSAFVHGTIGCAGVLRALAQMDRGASFCAAVAYADPGSPEPRVFESCVRGTIAERERGEGWGYDPIFSPGGSAETYAQMDRKNDVSHRAVALEKFAAWFTRTPQSCDQWGDGGSA